MPPASHLGGYGLDPAAIAIWGQELYDRLHQPDVMVRSGGPNTGIDPRISMGQLTAWDGTDPLYTPDLLIFMVELRGTYFRATIQGFLLLLMSGLPPPWQKQVWNIAIQFQIQGRELTWDIFKTEFLKRAGHVAAHTAHNALSLLLNGGTRQNPEHPVTQYLVAFQNKMREVGRPVDEAIAVELFLRRLLPWPLTDHLGCPHAYLSAAFDYDRGVELQLTASKAGTHRIDKSFARVRFMQRRQHRGRGRPGACSPISSTGASSMSGGGSKHKHGPNRDRDRSTLHSQQRRDHHYQGPASEPAGGSRNVLFSPQGAGNALLSRAMVGVMVDEDGIIGSARSFPNPCCYAFRKFSCLSGCASFYSFWSWWQCTVA
jgi:hypothetical protein